MRIATRPVGWLVLAVCVLATVAAAALAIGRGPIGADATPRLLSPGQIVAIVKLDGTITDAMVAPPQRGRDNVLSELRRAERDLSVKAVVLRVDSPGGSTAASQALAAQVQRLRQKGKPVVAYFADVAASGGLYVGVAADRIVAEPSTLTGSIGAIITATDLQGLYDRLGVHERVIKSGPYKDILSPNRDLTPEEQVILDGLVRDALDQFVHAVTEGRHLSEDTVRQLADGRVFSGAQAQQLGLLDELGDFQRAIDLAGQLAGLPGEPQTTLFAPPPPSLFDVFSGTSPVGGDLESVAPVPGVSVRYEWR